MAKVTFKTDLCKGCALCIEACPKKIIQLSSTTINQKGHYPAQLVQEELCIGCAFCATMCPDCVIKVER